MVKAYGSDSSWFQSPHYNAMSYHFLTQPLPNTLGRWIHLTISKYPDLGKYITLSTLVVEVLMPLLALLGSELGNVIVASSYILLQMGISLSGSYGKFILSYL